MSATSTLALGPVMAALIAKLLADATLAGLLADAPATFGGKGVYNTAPEDAARPYVLVEGGVETPFNTFRDYGSVCSVQLTAVSDLDSDAECLSILSRAKTVLDGKPLTVAGFTQVSVEWDSTQPALVDLVGGRSHRRLPAIVRVTVS